jgi:hypothetical protein
MLRNTLLRKSIKRSKKGDLTFNQIIIAVIALIVLTVVILIFSGSLRGPTNTLGSCAVQNGGKCVSEGAECSGIRLPGPFTDCTNENEKCCVNPMRN